MLKKYIHSTIIIMLYTLLPVALLIIFASQVSHTYTLLHQIQSFFSKHQERFLLIHGFFYLTLFLSWPTLIRFVVKTKQDEVTSAQIKTAMNSRWYLFAVLAFFELLFWWK